MSDLSLRVPAEKGRVLVDPTETRTLLEDVFVSNYPMLVRLAALLLQDAGAAEDVVQ